MSEHRVFLCILLLFLALGCARADYYQEFMLQGSDWNTLKVPDLFMRGHLPAGDDFEVGHLRYSIALTSIYYAIPLGLAYLGLPGDVFMIAQQLLGQALFFAALYYLILAVVTPRSAAAVAALLFFFADHWFFSLNGGYQILFNVWPYHTDVMHIAVVLMVGLLLRGRLLAAGVAAGAVGLLNVTYGLSAGLCLAGGALALRLSRSMSWRELLASLGAAGAGVICSGLSILLLLPKGEHAPAGVREVSIQSYGHVAIHAQSPLTYLLAVAVVFFCLMFAFVVERHRREGQDGYLVAFAAVMAATTLVFGLGVYWATYVLAPPLFIALSPGKWFTVMAFYLYPYAALALYRGFSRNMSVACLMLAVAVLSVVRGADVSRYWALLVLAMAVEMALLWRGRALPPGRRAAPVALAAALLLIAVHVGSIALEPFRDGRLRVAADLRDISLKIRAALPEDALLIQYRLPGTQRNFITSYSHLALRTYSDRGYFPFWAFGRIAYFDSMQRYRKEEQVFSAVGLAGWPEVLERLASERNENPLAYFTGVTLNPAPGRLVSFGHPAPWTALGDEVSRFQKVLEQGGPEGFLAFARKLGCTHVLVAKDPGERIAWAQPVLETDWFAVVPVVAVERPQAAGL